MSRGRDSYESTRLCLVSWDDLTAFYQAMLGTTNTRNVGGIVSGTPVGSGISRTKPEPHPRYPNLVALECELVEPVGYPGVEPSIDLIRFRTWGQVTPAMQGALLAQRGLPPVRPGGAPIEPDPNAPDPFAPPLDLLPPVTPGVSDATPPDVPGKAKVRVTYRCPPYSSQIDDGQIDDLAQRFPARQVNVNPLPQNGDGPAVLFGQGAEILRYCSRVLHPNVEATQIGGTLFFFTGPPFGAGGSLLPIGNESPAKVLPFGEVRITWHRVPTGAGLPLAALGVDFQTLLGRVNRSLFDLDVADGGTKYLSSLGRPYKMGTLLYLGCEQTEPYDHIGNLSGGLLCDWTFVFAYRPQGWAFIYRRQAQASGFQLAARVSPATLAAAQAAGLPTQADQVLNTPPADGVCSYNFGSFNDLFALEFA